MAKATYVVGSTLYFKLEEVSSYKKSGMDTRKSKELELLILLTTMPYDLAPLFLDIYFRATSPHIYKEISKTEFKALFLIVKVGS